MSGKMKVKSLSLSRKTQTPPAKEEPSQSMRNEDEIPNVSNLDAVLNSPISRPSLLQSTPVQRSIDITEDSPDHDYRSSPTLLFPCTQDSNEIAWDWNSTVNNTGASTSAASVKFDNNNMGSTSALNNTPKRPQHSFQKKRTAKAYSPLLNVPSKRKQLNLNYAKSIGKFAEELKALADIMKTEQNERSNEASETNEKQNGGNTATKIPESDSPPSKIFDMETQKIYDIHEASTMELNYVSEETKNSEKPNSSLEELFDDDLDDACMVQCSQEIENKLKYHSEMTRSKSVLNLSNEDKSGERKIGCGTSKSFSSSNIGAKTSCTVNIKTRFGSKIPKKASPEHPKSEERSDTKKSSTCAQLMMLNNIPESEIDDNSMEDSLALYFDDDEWTEKFLESEKIDDTPKKFNGLCLGDKRTVFNNDKQSFAHASSSNNQTVGTSWNFKRKQESLGSHNAATTVAENRKYLKTKSLSDSHCVNSALETSEKSSINSKRNSNPGSSYPTPIKRANSNSDFDSNVNVRSKAANAIQNNKQIPSTWNNLNNCIPAAGSRNNSSHINNASSLSKQSSHTKVSYSYLRTSNDNLAINTSTSCCDPYSKRVEVEIPLKELRTTAPTNSQQSLYKPEEIERKRLEAKKKLEANRLRNQINSNKSSSGVSGLQNKRPLVKR